MKTLSKYLYEKLLVNKDFKEFKLSDRELHDLITQMLDKDNVNLLNHEFSIDFPKNSLKKAIETTIPSTPDKNTIREFESLANIIDTYHVTYEYLYGIGILGTKFDVTIYKMFSELYKKLNSENVELTKVYEDTQKGYVIEYYKCNLFMIVHVGTNKFSYTYFAH